MSRPRASHQDATPLKCEEPNRQAVISDGWQSNGYNPTVDAITPSPLGPPCDPPYTAVIFTSVRTHDDHGYQEASDRMFALAALQRGYLGVESARDPDSGLGITVSYWVDADCALAWKAVTEHARVQNQGRELWYREYVVRVATVERHYGM